MVINLIIILFICFCVYKIFCSLVDIQRLYFVYFTCKFSKNYCSKQQIKQIRDALVGMNEQYHNLKRFKSVYKSQKQIQNVNRVNFMMSYYRLLNRILYKKLQQISKFGYWTVSGMYKKDQMYQIYQYGMSNNKMHQKFKNMTN